MLSWCFLGRIDLEPYVGKYVRIERNFRGAHSSHEGILLYYSISELCLLNHDKKKRWFKRPYAPSGSIRLLKKD